MQFSLRTLLVLLTLCSFIAAIWIYWPVELKVVSTDEFRWHDYSVGIVDETTTGELQHHGQTRADGHYITLREGEDFLRSTGGWYYQVGIQLPHDIEPNDVIDLIPASNGRHLEPVGRFDRLGFLQPNEFVAFYFGNPTGGCMACDDVDSHGRVKILRMTRDQVTFAVQLHASIPKSWDVDIDETFTLPRE